jgi:putative transposase
VECDHTKIDMMVIDEKRRLPLGRPWLTALIDVYTKMILGIYLSFHRPGAHSVLQCLLHAVRPKTYLKTVYPVVKNDWPAYGIPEEIWVDNAEEFYSSHFIDACMQLGIEPNYSPLGCAWFRATIERWFGTLNSRLLHELPGTTFSNIFHKKDYDPQKHAVISLDALLEIIHVWIVDYYHKRFHRGIQDIPYRRWTEGIVDDPPNLPPSSTDLEILIGFMAHRSISRSGIELFSLLYNSSGLSLIRRALDENEKVLIKYDPTDISMVYVWDKRNNKFVTIPALDQEYTRKLTVWQHHVIRRYARLFVKDHVDIVALCQAKEVIQKIIERERSLTKRISGQQKIAHYLNIGQPNYERAVEASSANNGKRAMHQELADLPPQLLLSDSPLVDISITEEDGWGADYDLPMEG